MTGRDNARQVIFGAADGTNSIVATLLGLTGASTATIVRTLLCVAVGAGLSMGASSWLSQDTDTGPAGGLLLGAATAVASALPAVPFLLLPRGPAPIGAAIVVGIVGVAVAFLRRWATGGGWRAVAETLGVIVVVAAVCAAIGAG